MAKHELCNNQCRSLVEIVVIQFHYPRIYSVSLSKNVYVHTYIYTIKIFSKTLVLILTKPSLATIQLCKHSVLNMNKPISMKSLQWYFIHVSRSYSDVEVIRYFNQSLLKAGSVSQTLCTPILNFWQVRSWRIFFVFFRQLTVEALSIMSWDKLHSRSLGSSLGWPVTSSIPEKYLPVPRGMYF